MCPLYIGFVFLFLVFFVFGVYFFCFLFGFVVVFYVSQEDRDKIFGLWGLLWGLGETF